MKKYKVEFSGFAHVEADDPAEEEEKFQNYDARYSECSIDNTEEVDEFAILF